MVDPDNRRKIDFAARAEGLRSPVPPKLSDWRNGRIKQRLIADLPAHRQRDPSLYAFGTYEPLALAGELPVIGFTRRYQDRGLLVVARLAAPAGVRWAGGIIQLEGKGWSSILTSGAAGLDLASLFPVLPVAVMEFYEEEGRPTETPRNL